MVVTILAIVFLIALALGAFFGYRYIVQQRTLPEDVNKEKCSICRQQFRKEELVERQIGDYRLLYFCRACVIGLYADLGMKN